jgi:hypothetical protein
MLSAGHRPADDLAIDQLDALVGVDEQVGDGLSLECLQDGGLRNAADVGMLALRRRPVELRSGAAHPRRREPLGQVALESGI